MRLIMDKGSNNSSKGNEVDLDEFETEIDSLDLDE